MRLLQIAEEIAETVKSLLDRFNSAKEVARREVPRAGRAQKEGNRTFFFLVFFLKQNVPKMVKKTLKM